jgi:hypothetical protein
VFSKEYQCNSLWFDPIRAQTHNLPHLHTCQVTRFRRVTPGNRACHPHFPEHPSGHGFHYDDPESPGIDPDIRNIYLFGKYRDFTYRKDNNPNGQLQSTTTAINNNIPSRY